MRNSKKQKLTSKPPERPVSPVSPVRPNNDHVMMGSFFPHCHRRLTIPPSNRPFLGRRFHHNICGDADRSSVSEETCVRKERSHSRGRVPSISYVSAGQLRTDAAISLGESRINVNLRLRVMKIFQNEIRKSGAALVRAGVARTPALTGACPSMNPGRLRADESRGFAGFCLRKIT